MSKLLSSTLTAALFGGAVCLCASVGGAQPVVDAHLQRGVELRREGRDAEAVVEFDSAYRLAPTPRTAGQLGLALQASGDWVRGYEMVREALATPSDAWITRNRAALTQAISAAEQHVGLLELRGGTAGSRVFLDGHSFGTLPMAREQPILAGRHTLEIRVDNQEPVSREIVVRAGELNREVVNESALGAVGLQGTIGTTGATTGGNVAGAVPSWPWFGVGLAAGGVGIATLVVGGIFYANALNAAGRFTSTCPSAMTSGFCMSLAQEVASDSSIGISLFVGGGVLLAGGIVLMALPRPIAGRGIRVSVRPAFGVVFVEGSF